MLAVKPPLKSSEVGLGCGREREPTLQQTQVTASARPDFGLPVAEYLHQVSTAVPPGLGCGLFPWPGVVREV